MDYENLGQELRIERNNAEVCLCHISKQIQEDPLRQAPLPTYDLYCLQTEGVHIMKNTKVVLFAVFLAAVIALAFGSGQWAIADHHGHGHSGHAAAGHGEKGHDHGHAHAGHGHSGHGHAAAGHGHSGHGHAGHGHGGHAAAGHSGS